MRRIEGIIAALERSHAPARAGRPAPGPGDDSIEIVNLTGRGDRDIDAVAGLEGIELYNEV